MSMLCLSLDLTSQEMAAWVQAVGSIVAIAAATWIAIWQGKKQHQNSLDLLSAERKHERTELAKTLSVLANNTLKMMLFLTKKIDSRQAVHDIKDGEIHFDLGELQRLDAAIEGIKLHELPDTLVTPTMFISSTVRQFREKIEMTLRVYREMDSEAYEDFFTTLGEMNKSFEYSCNDIAEVISKYEAS